MTKSKGSANYPNALPARSASKRGVEALYPDLWLEIFSHTIDVDCGFYEDISLARIAESEATSEINRRSLHSSDKSIDPTQPLRRILHTCRYWREIMRYAPLLWSQVIDCGRMEPMWLSRVLQYADDAPLVVRCSHLCRTGQAATQKRRELACNLNLFVVLISKNELKEFHGDFQHFSLSPSTIAALVDRFRRHMPQLTALSLDLGNNVLAAELFDSSPLHLFQGITPPKLKRVTFRHCPITLYTTQPWQNITYLSICNTYRFGFSPLSLLQQTPVLEYLVMGIRRFANLSNEAFFPARSKVKLPCLSRIQLSGPLEISTLFLGSLEPPFVLASFTFNITELQHSSSMTPDLSAIFHGISSSGQKIVQAPNTIRLDFSKKIPRIQVTINDTGHKYCFRYEEPGGVSASNTIRFLETVRPFFHACTCLIVEAEKLVTQADIRDYYFALLFHIFPWFVNLQIVLLRETTYSLVLSMFADVEAPHVREVIMPFAITKEFGYLDDISSFLMDRKESGQPICTLNFPSIYDSHKNTKSKKRVKMLKKLFGVNIKFRMRFHGRQIQRMETLGILKHSNIYPDKNICRFLQFSRLRC